MTARRDFRTAIDIGGLFATKLRHTGLTTPQGFDPLLPASYQGLIASVAAWRTDREFEFDPAAHQVLRFFGVRYFMTSEIGPRWKTLKADSSYTLLQPPTSFFKVFELRNPEPPYGWTTPTVGKVETLRWSPEHRSFAVHSDGGGTFRLAEQYYPGWTVRIDGVEATIDPCHQALQCVAVPAGSHQVEFDFRSRSLRAGAVVSATFLLACAFLAGMALVRAAKAQPADLH
jgi:hypothetical protein